LWNVGWAEVAGFCRRSAHAGHNVNEPDRFHESIVPHRGGEVVSWL